VPKKLLVYGSRYSSAFADARNFGWTSDSLRFDWPTLIGNVRREVDRLNGVYTRTLEKAGVRIILDRAVLEDPHTVRLANGDAPINAKTILVATGGHPMIPKLPGSEHLISSNECFQLEELPASIAIVGAGYIGMEFASIFAGLGVKVTVLHRGDQVLRNFDADLRDGLAEAMRKRGIDIRINTETAGIEKVDGGYRVHFKRGDSLHAGLVMAATGRLPNTMGLGLDKAGVDLGWNGHVVVDEFSRSCEVWLAKNYKAEYHVVDEIRGAPTLSNSGLDDKPPPLVVGGQVWHPQATGPADKPSTPAAGGDDDKPAPKGTPKPAARPTGKPRKK
jgi:glutathione reductase (NADPH)